MLAPVFEQASLAHSEVTFAKVGTEVEADLGRGGDPKLMRHRSWIIGRGRMPPGKEGPCSCPRR